MDLHNIKKVTGNNDYMGKRKVNFSYFKISLKDNWLNKTTMYCKG